MTAAHYITTQKEVTWRKRESETWEEETEVRFSEEESERSEVCRFWQMYSHRRQEEGGVWRDTGEKSPVPVLRLLPVLSPYFFLFLFFPRNSLPLKSGSGGKTRRNGKRTHAVPGSHESFLKSESQVHQTSSSISLPVFFVWRIDWKDLAKPDWLDKQWGCFEVQFAMLSSSDKMKKNNNYFCFSKQRKRQNWWEWSMKTNGRIDQTDLTEGDAGSN